MATTRNRRFLLSSMTAAAILGITAPLASALPPPLPPIKKAQPQAQQQRPRAQRPQQAQRSKAQLTFVNDTFDFGRIFDFEKQKIDYEFSNEGTEDLVITLIKPTCGCTLANIYKLTDSDERVVLDSSDPESMTFAPGERGMLGIVFDPKGKHGQQNKKVIIHSNDQKSGQRPVSINGFVRQLVQFDPPLISFGNLAVGNARTMTVRVMGLTDDFEASRPTFKLLGQFEAKVLGTEDIDFKGELLRATTIEITAPATLKPGSYNNTMHVRTNDSRLRIVNVPVFTAVKGPIEAVPPRLSVGNIKVGVPINRSFIVRARHGKEFTITDMTLNRDDLSELVFTSKPRVEGERTQYVITVSGTLTQPMARTSAILSITTDLKEHGVIQMPMVLGVIQ